MITRALLEESLCENTFLIPGADTAICGLTPHGKPIYNYVKLVEYYVESYANGGVFCDLEEEAITRETIIAWIEENIICNDEAPIVMYEVLED